jgi:hypothetical protein
MNKSSLTLSLAISLACGSAFAAPQGSELGPFRLFPEVGISFQHNDNIALQSDLKGDEAVSSAVTIFSPKATLVSKRRSGSTYSLGLGTEIGRYASSEIDNYEDVNVSANADLQLSRIVGLSLGAYYRLGHDPRGSTDRPQTQLDTYGIGGGNALFSYGSNARIGFEGEVGYSEKRYKDYSSTIIDGVTDSDTDNTNVAGRLFYRIMPKTRVFAEVTYGQTDYVIERPTQPNLNQDSDQWGVNLGARWRATAKTSGTAKIGYLKKDYDAEGREDFTGFAWQIGVQLKPLRQSIVDVYTGRRVSDSTGIGDFIDTQDISVSWTHNWMPRLSTKLGLYYANSQYEGNPREDDLTSFNLGVNYDLMKRTTLSAGVNFANRDSTTATEEYDQTVYMISINSAF